MLDAATKELLAVKEKRIRDAVALKTPDRVPVIPSGPAWPARAAGVKLCEMCTDFETIYRTNIEVYSGLGDVDGIQHPTFHYTGLSMVWLANVLVPGRDLPDDDLWQVPETELMTSDDYDAIVDEGFGAWLERYYDERLPGTKETFGAWAQTVPDAIAACREAGLVPFSPGIATIPYEYFIGPRTMTGFLLDLYRIPDKVQAAMDAAMPYIVQNMREMIRGLDLMGLWAFDCGRGASEFLAPKLWDRFIFPYAEQLIHAAIEEGAIPILHLDSNWTRDLARFRELPKGKCVLSLDGKTDIFKAKEILGDHMCIMGDVPASLFTLGAPDDVGVYCERLIREIGPSGFILSSGCDIPVTAKYENVKAMVDSVGSAAR
jgi:hypothetical protein